jgi:exodeoxyribonuclease VII small subunit
VKQPDEQTYEALMTRLAQVVERLEQGELPLAEALALYEEGVELGRRCEAHLQAATLRVEELAGLDGSTVQPWSGGRP